MKCRLLPPQRVDINLNEERGETYLLTPQLRSWNYLVQWDKHSVSPRQTFDERRNSLIFNAYKKLILRIDTILFPNKNKELLHGKIDGDKNYNKGKTRNIKLRFVNSVFAFVNWQFQKKLKINHPEEKAKTDMSVVRAIE